MIPTLIILGWLVCGVVAYVDYRRFILSENGVYTRGDRATGLLVVGLLAPVLGLAVIISKWFSGGHWDKPAKW